MLIKLSMLINLIVMKILTDIKLHINSLLTFAITTHTKCDQLLTSLIKFIPKDLKNSVCAHLNSKYSYALNFESRTIEKWERNYIMLLSKSSQRDL